MADTTTERRSGSNRTMEKLLEARNFGLIIGLLVFLLVVALTYGTVLIRENIEVKVLDFNFQMKNAVRGEAIQEGVTRTERNPNISPDILLVGIDDRSLSRFGKWPFPRYVHANLVDGFAMVRDQNQRERALFIDVFFIEPDATAEDDAALVQAIERNDNVFLESSLSRAELAPAFSDEFFERQHVLFERWGKIENVHGDWSQVNVFLGTEAPLKPYGAAAAGYGHANFVQDADEVFRRQPLVVRLSELVEEIPLHELPNSAPVDPRVFERLAWQDKDGLWRDVPFPITERVLTDLARDMLRDAPVRSEDTDNDGNADVEYFVLKKYRDTFVPAITLSLATKYFNKQLDDLEVVIGSHILIPEPQRFDLETGEWLPYRIIKSPAQLDADGNVVTEATYRELDEIRIPIDERGEMLVNFMGIRSSASPQQHQTFPVRSYSGYAAATPTLDQSRWPRTRGVANKIVMVGAFSKGMAADEKPTPFGLMYGVEIHANALNTIVMDKFLTPAPTWLNLVILLALTMITAFLTARVSTLWALLFAAFAVLAYIMVGLVVFDLADYVLQLSPPIIGVVVALISVVAYRVIHEERDKRRIRDMFGKYVSPTVVDQILADPPELGGVDKELTVFFSDIRGFTTLSEAMTPQELVNHLNVYLGAMTDLILEYRGTLDKYVGDEIMCFWGAPLPQEDHAFLACKCALHQMRVLHELNEQWPEDRRINIGIGLNSGIMTVGNMGSPGRMNYTLTGDNVNLGARLEGTNKQYMTNVIISEYTYALVKDRVVARELDNIRVKGKNKPVLIYELIDVADGYALAPPTEEEIKAQEVTAKSA